MTLRLAAALGNYDEKYRDTRHNVGFAVVRRLVEKSDLKWRTTSRYDWAEIACGADDLIVVRPRTYMNVSGPAVLSAVRRWDFSHEQAIIVHDDMDLPLGRLRFALSAGSGGHRGVESVAEALGSYDFPRLRVGIGRPPQGCKPHEYVLSGFAREQTEIVEKVIGLAACALRAAASDGIAKAMNKYNGRDLT